MCVPIWNVMFAIWLRSVISNKKQNNMQDIHFNFDKDKVLNVILYIAQHLKRKDFHKIFKILYFADREYLARYGMPITGDCYIAHCA